MTNYQQQLGKLLHINELNVTKKLRILIIFFLCTLTIMLLYTSITLYRQKSDGLIVNIAGRQRMLTQKFTKEFFLFLKDGDVSSKLTQKTKRLFNVSLKALSEGGETFKDLGMTKAVSITGTSNKKILAQLTKVASLWQKLQNATDKINVKNHTQQQLVTINKLSVNVLKSMNKAVGMFAKEADGKVFTLQIMLIILWFFSIIISLGIASVIVKSVTVPIEILIKVSKRFAKGDMTLKSLPEKLYGEMLILFTNMDGMRSSLSNVIYVMQQNIQQMLYSSNQISNVSTEISKSNIDERESSKQVLKATKSLQQISQTVSNQIEQASIDVEQTKKESKLGIAVVHQNISELSDTVTTVSVTANQMETLKKATIQIHQIIESIQDIADQTNLLALNATIEAARAGDAGKGFAVVASEIKALAKQTTNSASKISDLINHLTTSVDSSVDFMQQVVDKVNISQQESKKTVVAFENMTNNVNKILEVTNSINDNNQEQTIQLTDLNDRLNHFFSVMAKSAQRSDNIALVATSLETITDKVNASFEKFTIDNMDEKNYCEEEQSDNKRLYPRADNNIRCRIEFDDKIIECVSENISKKGLLIKSSENIESKENLPLQLFLPVDKVSGKQKEIAVTVNIKRNFIKNNYYYYGVEFNKNNIGIEKTMQDIFKYFKQQIDYGN